MSDAAKGACEAVLDDLALLVDGNEEALERHGDHLADCDECRDALHDSRQAARVVVDAGKDYAPPEDLEARVLAAIDAEPAGEEKGAGAAAAAAVVVEEKKEAEPAAAEPTRKRPAWVTWAMAAAAAAVVAAGAIGIWMSQSSKAQRETASPGGGEVAAAGTTASVGRIVRAAADGRSGIEVRAPGATEFEAAGVEVRLEPGAAIRTDNRTRVSLTLSDGSSLVLNHETELGLDRERPRLLHLARGEVLADVEHLDDGPNAVFEVPTGRVEVVGTKLVVTATDDMASVRVTRGQVRIAGGQGGQADVKAGEEGVITREGGLSVAPAVDLAGSIGWSELEGGSGGGEDVTMTGIGELRAKRPGEREARERPLALAAQKVRVRIVGNVARTEVEEVFRNDSGEVLEGTFRFPLPPDARIARLALDVDGRMVEGAFVERDRASKIWQGVIRRATPVPERRQQQDEYIWVPGPWRDPALLEWQQGGRFELRVFPIPATGSRRVVIAYDQTVRPHGRGRRYVYPLPHSADASTRIGAFDVDVRVAGAAQDRPVASHGYGMQVGRDGDATTLRFAQDGFLPAGDVVVDYELESPDSEIRWWTYQGGAAASPDAAAADPRGRRGSSPEVVAAQTAVAADERPYVAFAIRPELPGRAEGRRQDYVLVVDSSQSMVGERYARATELVTGLIAEMDRRDRFQLMACDATCRPFEGGLMSPSSQAALAAREWLGQIRPAGASDLVAALRSAAATPEAGADGERIVRVVYLGDGAATTGHRRAGVIASEVERLVGARRQLRFTTVGIGGDADGLVLGAVARAGGGHYVPYVPGERAGAAALAVLETTYGVMLESPTVELPEGVTDVAPAALPTIRAGEEVVVVGRFASELSGQVVVRGTVAGEPYVDRYPVHLVPSSSAGNAFVPRLWAAAVIDERQLSDRAEDRNRVVALSRAYGVMSRHTSLLVLESEAMFQAFGVDRARPALEWTGEEDAEMGEAAGTEVHAGATVAEASEDADGADERERRARGRVAARGRSGGGGGYGGLDDLGGGVAQPSRAAKSPPSEPLVVDAVSVGRGARRDSSLPPPARRPMPGATGGWMRRVWERVGSVTAGFTLSSNEERQIAEAETALAASPDSRDRHRDLVRALSRAGRLERALEVAEQWVTRDQLDPEALTTLADLHARMGRRDEGLRILTGVVDLRPDDVALHERLVEAFDRAAMPVRACSHRVAIAEIERDDPDAVGAALRCERGLGEAALAAQLLESLDEGTARERAERAAAEPAAARPPQGDLMVEATWAGGQDLDVSIVNAQGTRISWMGGRTNVVAETSRAPGREQLGLRWTPVGTYLIEVSRTDTRDFTPVSGQLRVRALGETRTVPFTLTADRAEVARVQVRRESRLVPAW